MLQIIVFHLLICRAAANVIFLNQFPHHNSGSKIWDKYVDNINYRIAKEVKSFQPKSLVLFRYLEKSFSVKAYLKSMQLMTNCHAGQNPHIKTVIGKICDIYLYNSTYPIRKYSIYPTKYSNLDRIRFLEECFIASHFLRIKMKNFVFMLHEKLMLNVTLIKVDIQLSHRCRTEYLAKGISFYHVKIDRICGKLPQMSYFFGHTIILRMQVLIENSKHGSRIELDYQMYDPTHVRPIDCCPKCSLLVSGAMCYNVGSQSNYQKPNQKESHLLYYVQGISSPFLGLGLQVFLIQVKRTSYFTLKFETFCLETRTYDGPYMMSKLLIIPFNHLTYTFSTFQGIQSHIINNTLTSSAQLKYTASTHISKCVCQIRNHRIYTISSEENATGIEQCYGNCTCRKNKMTYCVVEIQTTETHYINATFNKIQYLGPNIDSCRFGGVTVFDGERPVTVMCDTYSQNQSSSKVPMNIVSTDSTLTLVLHSYLDDIKVSFSFQEVTCAGIFIDPCAIQIIQGNNPIHIELFSFHHRSHIVKNNYILQHCDSGTYSKTHFLKFTLSRKKPCAVFQLLTPQWTYKIRRNTLIYHCKIVIFQNHANDNNVLQYTIKSFQFENVMVSPHDAPLKTINKHDQCHSALHHRVEKRELPGYGDILTFHFHGAQTTSHSHKISGQWCQDISSYIRVYHTPRCDLRILFKSHNSSLINYLSVLESPKKMVTEGVLWLGTLSARLLAWGSSWVSMTVTLKNPAAHTQGQLHTLPESHKFTACRYVQTKHRNSVLKLSLQREEKDNGTNCFLGVLTVELKFEDLCDAFEIGPTAIAVRLKLWRSMFTNNHYYLYIPMDYIPFYPVLSYNASMLKHTQLENICENTDLNIDWHDSSFPARAYKETTSCFESDMGSKELVTHVEDKGPLFFWTVSLDDLYEFDDEGNAVLKDQTELLERIDRVEREQRKVTSDETYYTLVSYKINEKSLSAFSWNIAAQKCNEMGFELVTISSISDLKKLVAHVAKSFYEERTPLYAIYIGIRREEEHNFLHQSGNHSLTYQLWRNSQFGVGKIKYEVFPRRNPYMAFSEEALHHVTSLENFLRNITWTLQPELSSNKRCSLLLLSNILNPEIIMVDCDAALINNIAVCKKHNHTGFGQLQNEMHCSAGATFISDTNTCYRMLHKEKYEFPRCVNSVLWDPDIKHTSALWSMLEAMTIIQETDTKYIFSKIKQKNMICKLLRILYSPLYLQESLSYVQDETFCNGISGLYMCVSSSLKLYTNNENTSNIFSCDGNTYISTMLLCDGIGDCVDGTDESFCSSATEIVKMCHEKNKGQEFSKTGCLLWWDKTGSYQTYTAKSPLAKSLRLESGNINLGDNGINSTKSRKEFLCNDNTSILIEFVNDTIPDCTKGEDELEHKLLLQSEHKAKSITCPDPTMLPCIPGHSKCFKTSELCVYRRNPVYNYLEYCRNGAHLAQCEKFSCNGDFKCPGYYCVHISHICDGVMDCPGGEDESNCKTFNCITKFRCKTTTNCIHIHEICDGTLHCLHGDDELACDIQICLESCLCLNYAIHCQQSDIAIEVGYHIPYIYVSAEGIPMSELVSFHFVHAFPQSLFMNLNHNFLTVICPRLFYGLPFLTQLNMNYNFIKQLTRACFADLKHLVQLSLKQNNISTIEDDSFINLSNLILLDLSSNQLPIVHQKSFSHLNKLSFLGISGNPILTINIFSLDTLFPSLREIGTKDFRICCLEKRITVNCEIKPPWPSSCGNILDSTTLQRSLLSIACTVVSLSALCLFGHIMDILNHNKAKCTAIRSENLKCGYDSIVILVNISDITFSVYLLTLVIMDFIYKGHFSNFERYWRKSLLCHFMSFVYIFSSFVSMFSVTFLALTRNRIITNPMDTSFSEKRTIKQLILLGTAATLLVSALLTLSHRFVEENVFQSNSLCLLIGNLGDSKTIKFTTGFFATVELCSIILNISLYTHLVARLFKQKQELAGASGKGRSNLEISTVIQLMLVGISNILCWAPGGVLNIISLLVKGYSIKVLLWITTVATPLNGIVNPTIFNCSLLAKLVREKGKK